MPGTSSQELIGSPNVGTVIRAPIDTFFVSAVFLRAHLVCRERLTLGAGAKIKRVPRALAHCDARGRRKLAAGIVTGGSTRGAVRVFLYQRFQLERGPPGNYGVNYRNA